MTLDILGALLGLLYLYLEIKQNHWMWVVGSIMPMIYIVVLYQAGLYADCGMEVYYFLAGLYGLWYWLRHGTGRGGKALPIIGTPSHLILPLVLVTFSLWAAMAYFLSHYTDSTVPMLDALTTALSIVGLWMLSRKMLEQWLVWLVVDAISTGLYIYKGIYARSALYGLYTLLALYGYWKWRKTMTETPA